MSLHYYNNNNIINYIIQPTIKLKIKIKFIIISYSFDLINYIFYLLKN